MRIFSVAQSIDEVANSLVGSWKFEAPKDRYRRDAKQMLEEQLNRRSTYLDEQLAGSQSQSSIDQEKDFESKHGKTGAGKILNAMTVDVEDYFQVSAFEQYIAREKWNQLECRVEKNIDKILDSFNDKNVKATFFTLGWIAKRYPEMIKRIVREGHELASHGWDHTRVINQSRKQFANDIKRAKRVLEDVSSTPIYGYRAASYSINKSNLWAHDILRDAGYLYSSSIAPIKYAEYGIADAPRFAHYRRGDRVVKGPASDAILEVPVTTVSLPKKNIPCGGGGWFRLYPYSCSKWALKWVNAHDKQPTVFYFHPWEIDPLQPRQVNIDWKTKFRHYQNLGQMESKLNMLFADFRWGRMKDVFDLDVRRNIIEEDYMAISSF